MPELPEVETIRRALAPRLEGRTFVDVRVARPDILMGPRSVAEFSELLVGRQVRALERRGKRLVFRLDAGVLVAQLRMTGRFCLGDGPAPPVEEFRHVAARFRFDDGSTLFYDDVRRLGGFRRFSGPDWEAESARLGPEPLAPGFRATDLAAALGRGRAPVKSALLDQGRIAGVGNIYACEALFGARLAPHRPVDTLTAEDFRRLHRALRDVLRRAVDAAGTTLRDYRAVNGRSGRFASRLRVYGRAGAPCRRCGAAIERTVLAGRGTFSCPACQA
ncbi:MAG: bifunctional DNA-formamidopyrimidine glycosylase/DNA-(apurinic or apyrimidinic site) lyase [Gemmatimonadota bacterium]|nr:bifunctional DNA-formamidopyrimidine glycosylase/DNA-(apurinic or apyrimidinic site) lyase [Gemmatimonadota bacterium]